MQLVLADHAVSESVSWPRPEVGVLRGRRSLLLVHAADGEVTVTVEGRRRRLGPYEVRYVPVRARPPAVRALIPGAPKTGRCLRVRLVPRPTPAATLSWGRTT